jgi:non-homologous end joining protein Ku
VQPEAEETAAVPDLMSALQASLDEVRKRTGSGSGGAKKPAAAKKRTTKRAKAA